MRRSTKLFLGIFACFNVSWAQAPTFTEYAIPTAASFPGGIAAGPDGALWFVESGGNKIGRISTAGVFSEYPVPTASSHPFTIAAGPDGALWFVEYNGDKIGRITTAGVVTEYAIPTLIGSPTGIAAGPDGALWFTENYENKIGRITTAGVITEYYLLSRRNPWAIVAGPDGAMWFTENSVSTPGAIGRITTGGVINEFNSVGLASPSGITVGPDGAIWFTEENGDKIGRITTAGVITEYPTPTANSQPYYIVTGPDGALWFTEPGANQIGRVTPSGTFTEYPIPTLGGLPFGIALGPDGALWFSEDEANKIARASVATAPPGPTISGAQLPMGVVGSAYAASLIASGGMPPYANWTVAGEGTLPASLALNSSTGEISGTPTIFGLYNFDVTVQDSLGVTSAAQAFSIQITQGSCTDTISPSFDSFPPSGGNSLPVRVTAGTGCAWSVLGTPPWVTILSGASGIGNGNVTYSVSPNTTSSARTATLAIAGNAYTISQDTGPIFAGSMPHLAAEGGWTTTFTMVNEGSNPAPTEIDFFNDSGGSLGLPLTFPQLPPASPQNEPGVQQTIPANASLIVSASGPADVPYLEGSAQLLAGGGTSVGGFAIFHYDPTQQEAVVPLETRTAPSFLLPFDNTNGVQTGVALNNISFASPNVPVTIRDDTGQQIYSGVLPTLNSYGHTSFVLSTEFPVTAGIRGTIEFDTPGFGTSNSAQIAALGIRYTPPGTLTSIPTFANVGTNGGAMAHLASGAGWQTTFALVNTGTADANATLNFFGDDGTPLALPLTFLQTGAAATMSSVTQTIPAGASLWVLSSGPIPSTLLSGSAQLTTTGNISGYAIFRYNPNGQEAVVPLETRAAASYLIAFDNTEGTATGIAVANASPVGINVPVTIRDDAGNIPSGGTISLAANGHTSFLLTAFNANTANIRGTMEFDAPTGTTISVLGIRSPPTLTFTTLPALAK